jgi:hypothetical protein
VPNCPVEPFLKKRSQNHDLTSSTKCTIGKIISNNTKDNIQRKIIVNAN